MCRPAGIAGCGNCGPMQSAGSMYFSMGGGGREGTCCNFTCKLYMMLSNVHLWSYKYVGLTLNCVHCGPCFMDGVGLQAAAIVDHCGLQLLRANELKKIQY